tara:strand:+ start:43 stop:384 length:342 start_codon:yes stop_codon:yes gene_type:complete
MPETFDNYGKDHKRLIFNVTDHDHAKLIVRLRHNSLTQAEFFRAVIHGVNTSEQNICAFIENYLVSKQKLSKQKIKKSKTLRVKGEQLIEDFALTDGEVGDIFDLIAEEHPDL